MKVLIVGSNYFSYLDSIAEAFSRMGHDATSLEFSLPRGGIKNLLKFGLPDHLSTYYGFGRSFGQYTQHVEKFNKELLNRADDWKPELVLIIRGEFIDKESISYIRQSGTRVILWMYDSIKFYQECEKYLDRIDGFFSYEPTDVEYVKKRFATPAYYLPLAFDQRHYHPIAECPKETDIFFIGALHRNRIAMIDNLCKHFRDKNISIHSNYLSRDRLWRYAYLGAAHPALFRCLHPAIASHQVINERYNHARITINIHNTSRGIQQGVNFRFFELLGSGSFQLVEREYLEKVSIQPKEGVVPYDSAKQMCNLVDQYLADDFARQEVIHMGERVAMNHTLEERLVFMLHHSC